MNRTRTGNFARSWLKRLTGLWSREPLDRAALIEMLRRCEQRDLLDPDALIMIEGAIHVYDMQARDIMIPRVRMIVVRFDTSLAEIVRTIVESGHSRFPVVGDDTNNVLGVVLAKDLLASIAGGRPEGFDIKDIMRPAVFVPESKRVNVLLREFRASRNHMAIVIDEYGVAGLVTIEDVIEEIVGEIEDEHDLDEEESIRQHGKNRFTVQAITPIEEFNEYFQTSLVAGEYDTVGGLIVKAFGHLPARGESIDFAGYNVKVLRADRRRVQLLRFERVGAQDQRG